MARRRVIVIDMVLASHTPLATRWLIPNWRQARVLPRRQSGGTWVLTAIILVLLPLAWLPIISLQPDRAFALGGPNLAPGTWTLANFAAAWGAGMPNALLTSAALAITAMLLTILLVGPAAFALARPFPGRTFVLGMLLFGLVQPAAVTLIPLFSLLKDLGLLGTV